MAQASSAAARLGMGMGWFSLALGLVHLARPLALSRYAGLPATRGTPRLMRGIGLRELATGAGILLRPHKPGWLWSRVAGDAFDLALLGWAARKRGNSRLSLTTAAVAGVTVLDALAAIEQVRLRRHEGNVGSSASEASGAIRVRKTVMINASPEACYRYWRNFENFPHFMKHVDEVRMLDATRSHWRVRAPLGQHVEWTAELDSDVPAQQLGWRTLPDAWVEHAGVVRFVPAIGGRGTRVDVDLRYRAPLGATGSRLAKLFGEEPSQQIDDDLRRFRQLIETGEIPTTIGQSSGRRSLVGRALHRGAPG